MRAEGRRARLRSAVAGRRHLHAPLAILRVARRQDDDENETADANEEEGGRGRRTLATRICGTGSASNGRAESGLAF